MTDLPPDTFELMRQEKSAYQTALGSAETVMDDLARFCRANRTCVVAPKDQPVDLNRTLVLEGRREVYLRIREYLDLTPEQLAKVRGATFIDSTGAEE